MADLLLPFTTEQADEKIVYSNLPCPVGYDEVTSEAFSSTMVPGAYYGLGAYYVNTKLALTGNVYTDDTLTARVKAVITDKLIVTAQTQLINEFNTLVNFEYMVFGASVPQKSGVGYAARYETKKMVASAQVVSAGNVLITYVHKISKKVSLATDFVYNCFSREVKASVGFDCISRQSRVQGKIDSNGVAYALLEKQINMGLECLLSASLDHKNKDYRFGLSLSYGSPHSS